MNIFQNNIKTESKTINVMITMYCNKFHNTDKGHLCMNCDSLFRYSHQRLSNCIFLEDKPSCKNCPTHCYKNTYRNQIIKVMKYAGPRMIFSHPKLALLHIIRNNTNL